MEPLRSSVHFHRNCDHRGRAAALVDDQPRGRAPDLRRCFRGELIASLLPYFVIYERRAGNDGCRLQLHGQCGGPAGRNVVIWPDLSDWWAFIDAWSSSVHGYAFGNDDWVSEARALAAIMIVAIGLFNQQRFLSKVDGEIYLVKISPSIEKISEGQEVSLAHLDTIRPWLEEWSD